VNEIMKNPETKRDLSCEKGEGDAMELLQHLLESAFSREASDIHLDGWEDRLRVRFRIHGILIEQPPLSRRNGDLLLRRIKVFGGMDPRRFGCIQDGSASIKYAGIVRDIRFAITVGVGHRECAAIRLFQSGLQTLEDLDLSAETRGVVEAWIQNGIGLFLIGGPTGCGKTSTLYSILHRLAQGPYSIVTLENPVERRLEGIRQIDVGGPGRPGFSEGLRSLMRQDPDVLMIGEIRDAEAARTAIDAALSGHRVLATIHAPHALSVEERLRGSFGIDAQSLRAALEISMSQRLVPLLCRTCRRALRMRPVGYPGDMPFFESPGCAECGYTGRMGRKLLVEIREKENGLSLRAQAHEMLKEGRIDYRDAV